MKWSTMVAPGVPMSGSGQFTGDIWGLHAYAHRATRHLPASWTVKVHCARVAEGFADSLPEARKAAERVIATLAEAAAVTRAGDFDQIG